MIVCLCKGVSNHTIQREVRKGARTVGAVARCCQAGTGCGACVTQIRDMIAATAASGHDHGSTTRR